MLFCKSMYISDLRYILMRQYIDTFFMYHNTILWYKNIDTGNVILILKSRVLNKMFGNYGHKMNTKITDNGNDDGAGTPGIELAAENEDNILGQAIRPIVTTYHYQERKVRYGNTSLSKQTTTTKF